jgi:hypothetical protein
MWLVFLLKMFVAIEVTIFCHLTKADHQATLTTAATSLETLHIWRQMRSPHKTGYATLYRAGMTNVVLHCLFIQQNQRV